MGEELLDQLICSPKARQWLQILTILEHGGAIDRTVLMEELSLSRKGLGCVLEELIHYFGQSITVKRTSETVFMRLEKPLTYRSRKQDLLSEEPLLRMVQHCFLGMNSSRKEWEAALQLSPAQFYQQRKQLSAVLEQYGLYLEIKELKISGPESLVRQFFFEIYFELPLIPIWMEATRQHLFQTREPINLNRLPWPINEQLFNQWQVIFEQRNRLGHELPIMDSETSLEISRSFVGKVEQTYGDQTPEFAALCLLSLEKGIILSDDWQNHFFQEIPVLQYNHSFKEALQQIYNLSSKAAEIVASIAHVRNHLFEWEKPLSQPIHEASLVSNREDRFVEEWVRAYHKVKSKKHRIYCQFELQGPVVLKEWVMRKVKNAWSNYGIVVTSKLSQLIQEEPIPLVIVSNHMYEKEERNAFLLQLSEYPTEQEVMIGCKKLSTAIRLAQR